MRMGTVTAFRGLTSEQLGDPGWARNTMTVPHK